jgi:hypothetical protein
MTNETSPEQYRPVEELVLDRIKLAISLREQGMDVDFEEWDGLSDESVTRIVSIQVGLHHRNKGENNEV